MEDKFNLNDFYDNLDDVLHNEVSYKGNRDDILERMEEVIDYEIDNACMYTDDCWDIAKDLVGTENFSKYDMATNIVDLAYSALRDEVMSQIDFDSRISKEKRMIKQVGEEI